MSIQNSVNSVLSNINTLQQIAKNGPEAQAKIDAEKAEAERLKEQEFFDNYFKNNTEPYTIKELTSMIKKETKSNNKIYNKLKPEEGKDLLNNSIDNFFKNINEANDMEMSAMRNRAISYAVKTGDLSNFNKLNAYYRSEDIPEQMSQQANAMFLHKLVDKLPSLNKKPSQLQKDQIGESKADEAQMAAQTKIAKQKNQMQNAKKINPETIKGRPMYNLAAYNNYAQQYFDSYEMEQWNKAKRENPPKDYNGEVYGKGYVGPAEVDIKKEENK